MPSGDLERSERLDADRRYNDALTALDRAVVELAARPDPTRGDISHLGTLLLVFLQQITAYVDTKDREASAVTAARLDTQDQAIGAIPDLGQQIAVLQRLVQALKRDQRSLPAPPAASDNNPNPSSERPRPSGIDNAVYVGFEDRFRGSGAEIENRMRAYLPLFEGAEDVLDVGCGRGEFLMLLREAGVRARGVDTNLEMVEVTRDRGLDAHATDGLTYLRSLPSQSLGGLMASQVVEHLEPAYLVALLETAYDTLRPGAPMVIETINPACWLAFFSSYIRDLTHVRPVHPDTLQYLLQATGFTRVSVRYSAPVPQHMKMKPIDLSAQILTATDPIAHALVQSAHVANANAAILNNLLFTHLDYAAIGYRS